MAITDAQLIQIENQALALNARTDRISAQINNYVATVNAASDPSSQFVTDGKALEAEAVDTLSALNSFNNLPAVLEVRAYGDLREQQRVNNALEVIRQARSRADTALSDVRSTLASVGTREPLPENGTNSAGLIVDSDGNNRTEFAVTQNPEAETDQGDLAVGVQSNADTTETQRTTEDAISNTDDATVRAVASDRLSGEQLSDDSGAPPIQPTLTQGVNGIPVSSGYFREIRPRENVLSKFETQTYNITLYMLNDQQLNRLLSYDDSANADVNSPNIKDIRGFNAILSSGGMPASYDPFSFGGAVRNPNFDLDYFIDDVEIDSLMPQQVRGATNATSINFTVTEPYGFTFLTRLKQASQEITGNADWLKQHYLMIIRFYGQTYGNAAQYPESDVDAGGGASANGGVNVIGQRPITEKYIPFKFRNITTKARTGAVEYVCDAVPINHLEAMSQKRATVKYQVEVNGQTLNDLFNGRLAENVTQSGDRTVKTGLVESINKYYRQLASAYTDPATGVRRDPVIGIADQFEVKFLGGIGEQLIRPPGTTKKNRTGMADPTFPTLLDSSRNSVQKNRLTFSVNAGTQIQQFIDLAVRSSEWITNQQKKYIDPNTKVVRNKSSNNFLQWYRITSTVESLGYDNLRKDYAYKITYIVIPSAVTDVKSSFFPQRRFNGCQKRYKYWFTGENTEILNYEIDFNALYYVSASPLAPPDPSGIGTVGETTSPGPSDQSILGGADLASDPAARAASVLYSPTDYAMVRLNILGDPFYIQQGDIFWRSLGVQDNDPGYLPDGSADYDSGPVLVEVDFNTIEDYDEETGIAQPRPVALKSAEERQLTTTVNGTTYNGLIYELTQVTNKFSKGMFTQDLQGVQKYMSPVTRPDLLRSDPEVRPTTNVSGGSVTSTSGGEPVIPPILVSQGTTSTTSQGPGAPTLGGLTLSGAQIASPDDAED